MPLSPQPTLSWSDTILSLAMVTGFLAGLLFFAPLVAVGIGVFLAVLIATIPIAEHQHRLALAPRIAERRGESICTFARSFDYRRTDTWIIRAVFEELQPWAQVGNETLPIRPEDELKADLRMDSDDLDDLIITIAHRSRRSITDCTTNPLLGQVRTIADLVAFLMHQPSFKTVAA